MKNLPLIIIFFLLIGCSNNKQVYWCGDHACLNKKEREEYFKKNKIVEVRNYDDSKKMSQSEIKAIEKYTLNIEKEDYKAFQERIDQVREKYKALRNERLRKRVEEFL